jgi:methylmalonyl-CoA mutase C-terminal domain/subunit
MGDVKVVVGGIIPAQDISELKRMGVSEVFLPGASLAEVVRSVEGAAGAQ